MKEKTRTQKRIDNLNYWEVTFDEKVQGKLGDREGLWELVRWEPLGCFGYGETVEEARENCLSYYRENIDKRVYDGFSVWSQVAKVLGIPHLYVEKMAITIQEGEPVRIYMTSQITNRQLAGILDAIQPAEIIVDRVKGVEIMEGVDDFNVRAIKET